MKIEELTKEPHEGLKKAIGGTSAAFVLGFSFSFFSFPSFIKGCREGICTLVKDYTVEGNFLFVASILIGVAVVQGQNLNRLKDVYRELRDRRKGRLLSFLNSPEAAVLADSLLEKAFGENRNDMIAEIKAQRDRFKDVTRKDYKRQLERTAAVYQDLITGFWVVSFGVVVVLILLIFSVLLGEAISTPWAHFLATLWWAAIFSILIGWVYLARVALASYRREAQ